MLKPVDADVHFKYICPGCNTEMWASLAEARTPRFILLCSCCNKPYHLKPVHKLRVLFEEENVVGIAPAVPQPKVDSSLVSILVGNGYDVQSANKLIEEALKTGLNEKQSIIRWCLQNG